jgi:hypothetical protein
MKVLCAPTSSQGLNPEFRLKSMERVKRTHNSYADCVLRRPSLPVKEGDAPPR